MYSEIDDCSNDNNSNELYPCVNYERIKNFCRYNESKWRKFKKDCEEHSKYLTDKFKDGKLPAGEYFVSRKGDNHVFLDFLFEDGKFGSYDDIDRVYMVMPTYEELITFIFKSHISQ